jgi:hypothetical protein
MMPRLLELAWLISHLTQQGRRTTPSAAAGQTIDGMLFVGIRPASRHAA